MKNKKAWIVLSLVVLSYTGCFGDRYVSDYVFGKVCNDRNKVGLFIYEQVELSPEYLKVASDKEAITSINPRLLVSGNQIINVDRFSEDFIYKQYEKIPVSSIGPVSFLQSHVVRRSDGKVLGKAVSATNGRGWFTQWRGVNFGGGGVKCPQGSDIRTQYSYYRRDHELLISNIFSSKIKGVDK